jgi:hypothetical protein
MKNTIEQWEQTVEGTYRYGSLTPMVLVARQLVAELKDAYEQIEKLKK